MTATLIIWLPFAGLLGLICALFGFSRPVIVALYVLGLLIIHLARQ